MDEFDDVIYSFCNVTDLALLGVSSRNLLRSISIFKLYKINGFVSVSPHFMCECSYCHAFCNKTLRRKNTYVCCTCALFFKTISML